MADHPTTPRLWTTLLLAGAAGGLGWGIRGQYGHQTGAMVPGVLVGLVLVMQFGRHLSSLSAARAVALTAIAIAWGGCMTYGQTVGLTHDAELRGNWGALSWGMLGLFIKGAIWIGPAGAVLGMALGERRYGTREWIVLLLVLIGVMFLGRLLLNYPFDPAARRLPPIYFSDHWHWEPHKADLRPRGERWGGLLLAFAALRIYTGWFRKDRLASGMAGAAALAGGIGFALGQSVQALHAWRPDLFEWSPLAALTRHMNWWNLMEIIFGTTMAVGLAIGLWLLRRRIGRDRTGDDTAPLHPVVDTVLLLACAAIIVVWEFGSFDWLEFIADMALPLALLPIVAVTAGRLGPYLFCLPLIALPIAGKTLRQLSYRTDLVPVIPGRLYLVVLPLAVMIAAALLLARTRRSCASTFAPTALLVTSWTYFLLNFAIFEFPWPWQPSTFRTPSNWIFVVCVLALTIGAIVAAARTRASDV